MEPRENGRRTEGSDARSAAAANATRLHDDYVRAVPSLRRYLGRRCPCPATVDDIVSASFECALRQLRADPDFELREAWLMTVAKRRLIDHWRGEERTERLRTRLSSRRVDGVEGDVVERQAVERTLDALSPRYRDALVGKYCVGLPVAAVAELLDTSYSGAESVLTRARSEFRRRHELLIEN